MKRTPRAIAERNAGSVFSGNSAEFPRYPTRCNNLHAFTGVHAQIQRRTSIATLHAITSMSLCGASVCWGTGTLYGPTAGRADSLVLGRESRRFALLLEANDGLA